MFDMREVIGPVKDAAKEALRQMRTSLHRPGHDPELSLYNHLTAEQFMEIERDYGTDALIEYVEEMEARRGGPHAQNPRESSAPTHTPEPFVRRS